MYPNIELWKLHLLFVGNKNSATPNRENHPLLDVAKKYVEMYSSSNAPSRPQGKGTADQYTIYTTFDKLSHAKVTKRERKLSEHDD